MRNLKITLIISLIVVTTNIFGQSQLFILKDSSLIHGEILNYTKEVIIVKSDNKVETLFKNDILEIYKDKTASNYLGNSRLTFYNISDIGMLAGERDDIKKYSLSFHMINGVEYNKKATLGLGFGVELMDFNLIPLFADFRWNINKNNIQAFVGIQGGFVFPIEQKSDDMVWDSYYYKMGYFYNPMIGIKANINNSIGLNSHI